MSSSIDAYLVDMGELLKLFGCKDEQLLNDVIKKKKIDKKDTDPDDFEEAEEGDEDIDLDELEALPSSQDALKHIIMGEPWARGIGSKYGYVFLSLCSHLYTTVDTDSWGQTRAEWVETFDNVLKKLKVPQAAIRMQQVLFVPADLPLPPRYDAPTIGILTVQQAKLAAEALAAVTPEALEKASQNVKISRGEIEPEFVVASFKELQSWCAACIKHDKDLLTFYY
jgi:hypothetical protein